MYQVWLAHVPGVASSVGIFECLPQSKQGDLPKLLNRLGGFG